MRVWREERFAAAEQDGSDGEAVLVKESVLQQSCGEVGAAEDECVSIALLLEFLYFGDDVAPDQFCVGPIGAFECS